MGTPQILVVLAALMALISLVGIGIDWIGKPLRNRRFIERIYRYDDEKLPVDALGRTTFPMVEGAPPPAARQVVYVGGPNGTAPLPHGGPPPVPAAVHPPLHLPRGAAPTYEPVVPEPSYTAPSRTNGRSAPATTTGAAGAGSRGSVFSDAVASADPSEVAFSDAVTDRRNTSGASGIAGRSRPDAERSSSPTERTWRPGLPLDMQTGDDGPTLADKAHRFWQSTARSTGPSHFDDDDRERMALGKAPRRLNPRTGRSEVIELGGLRIASRESEVLMRWPDDSVDPWSAR